MQVRMNGNFENLGNLSRALDRLASEGMRDAEHRAAVAVDQQVERQFASGEDSDGQHWANKADGSPSHLQRSGDMKRSKRVTGIGGIRLTLDKPAGFHQSGTKNADGSQRMQARPIVPTGDSLPGNWSKPISAAVSEVFEELR